jgi:hypothetical protein
MDKETVIHIHNGILFSYKEEQNYGIFRIMDGPGDHCVKPNKLESERQILRFLSYAKSRFSMLKKRC